MYTIKCKVVAISEGTYTTYVFEDLNRDNTDMYKYIMCTRVPNWESSDVPELNAVGYLQTKFVNAGDAYFNVALNAMSEYKYTNWYFINFIKEIEKETQKEFNF